jgi:ABC-type Fe3+ transport system permease subunit
MNERRHIDVSSRDRERRFTDSSSTSRPTTPRSNRTTPQPLSARAVADRWWAASGLAVVAFFVLGLIFADLLASPGFPAYNASLARIDAFFIDDRAEAIGISVCHTLSAAALLAFVAYLHEWLHDRTETRLRTLALGAGVAASAFLLLSAMLYWTLTRTRLPASPESLRPCSCSPTSPADRR